MLFKTRAIGAAVAVTLALAISNLNPASAVADTASDAAALRSKWLVGLTGGPSIDLGDTAIAAAVSKLTAEAEGFWDTMVKSPTRTYLWTDAQSVATVGAQMTTTYTRIRQMALAYRTTGSALAGDAGLRTDIVNALEWLDEHVYGDVNQNVGWWDVQIGVPRQLLDTVNLMYADLSQTQRTTILAPVIAYPVLAGQTGANRVWIAGIIAKRGALLANASDLGAGRDGLGPVFPFVSAGDGFYEDGSFIQHGIHPYNGGYGATPLRDISWLMAWLNGSPWEVTDPASVNVVRWAFDAFEPFIRDGLMMDMVRGREIARSYTSDHDRGHSIIDAVLLVEAVSEPDDAAVLRSMAKTWVLRDVTLDYFAEATIPEIIKARMVVNSPSVGLWTPAPSFRHFESMDRAVQRRGDYDFALSMSSSRIGTYEALQYGANQWENTRGWYTGEGMTYLYNTDGSQYTDDYWPTVNPYRLPGTTVDTVTRADNSGRGHVSSQREAGGVELGAYGTSAMKVKAVGSTLVAKKSWFAFDDEIIALGAGVTSTDARTIETIVENRKLAGAGGQGLRINGSLMPSTVGWSTTATSVTTAHLEGNVAGADIGYYFPTATTVKALRESRTGSWKDIDTRPATPTTPITARYATFWIDHGVNPTNASYSYALLPGKSSTALQSYAADPDFAVLSNTGTVQAVREENLGIVAAQFWTGTPTPVGGITSTARSAVMTQPFAGGLTVAVSDPSQQATTPIEVELDFAATALLSASDNVTVLDLEPKVRISVDTEGGRTYTASFTNSSAPSPFAITVDNSDPSVSVVSGWTTGGGGDAFVGSNYVHDQNAGKGTKSVVFAPQLPAGTYRVLTGWRSHPNRATNVPIAITHAGGSTTVNVNQTVNGSKWNSLGVFEFNGAAGQSVTISTTGTNGYVVADGVRFEFLATITVDNSDPSVSVVGGWTTGGGGDAFVGSNYVHDQNAGKGTKSVVFAPQLPAGTYRVLMGWRSHPNRATNVPIAVTHAGGSTTVSVNQTVNGSKWNSLGVFEFNGSVGQGVTISTTGTNGYVVADGVRFEPVAP